MFELEKLYINPKIKKTSSYFSRIVKKGFPLENNIRYIFNNDISRAHLLEKDLDNKILEENSIVKFLFRIDKYNTFVLSRHTELNIKGSFSDFKQQLLKIKKSITKSNFFIGCVLKQVKGGFTIELDGLVCFMPYSLSDGSRFSPYKPKVNAIQLFQPCGLSLVIASEGEVFLNLIVSRKNNEKLLKGLLKKSFGKNEKSLTYLTPLNRRQVVQDFRKTKLRLLSNSFFNKNGRSIRMMKEVFLANKNTTYESFLHRTLKT